MAGYSPPRVSNDTALRLAVTALGVLLAGLIVGRVLVVVAALLAVVSAYVLWRFLRALEAVADGTQRLAAVRERSVRPQGDDSDDATDDRPA